MDMCREMSKILCLLFLAARVEAHHAFAAEYDVNKVVKVSGTVTKFTWSNPHAWLYVDGMDESGKAAIWGFEMGSPNGLINRGWRQGEVKQGDRVTIDGYAAKDKGNTANARNVILPDGRRLFGGFQSTPRESGK